MQMVKMQDEPFFTIGNNVSTRSGQGKLKKKTR